MRGPNQSGATTPSTRPVSVVARAGLFVALSAFAVPACQHFDATDKQEQAQAARASAAAPKTPAVDVPLIRASRV